MLQLDPEISAKLGTLQSLDDAMAYRSSRLDLPCRDCRPGQKCTDHAGDVRLLETYQERYIEAFRDAVAGMDPADMAKVLQPGDDMPPPSDIMALSMAAHLRNLAADGPVMTKLDGRPVIIEVDGTNIIERPVSSNSDGAA